MPRSWRPSGAADAVLVALLLTVVIVAGCGGSTPALDAAHPTGAGVSAARRSLHPKTGSSPTAAGAHPRTPSSAALAVGRPKTSHPVAPAHPVPAAFRPAPGAPSDAEVRKELAQMASIQGQERQRALSAAAANLAGLLPWAQEPKSGTQVSVASVFTDYGLGLACGGLLGREELGVAHKTAPCGTLVTFTYAGRSLTVPVIDRGPYIVGREWDLTGATAAALHFPGLGRIEWSLAG